MSLTALGFVLLFFFGIIKALMGRPIFGLYSYILSIYMYAPGSWWGAGLPDLRWSLFSALATLISIWMAGNKANALTFTNGGWANDGIVKFLICFVLWVWLQNLWAIAPVRHFEFSVMVTKFLLLIYLIKKSVHSERDLYSILIAHLLGGMYFGYLGLTQHTGGRFESAPTPGMSDGNLLSIHMLSILIAGSYLVLCNFDKRKFLLGLPIVLTLNAIFLTESRGALVGIVLSALLAMFFVPAHLKKVFRRYMVLAVLGVSLMVGQNLVDRINSISEPNAQGEVDKSAASRVVFIEAQTEMFKEKPYIGQGHKGTMYLSPDFIPIEFMTNSGGGTMLRASHNLTMSYLIDHGVIGSLLYFGSVSIAFLRLIRLRSNIIHVRSNLNLVYVGCCVALFSILVTSQFSNSIRLEIAIWFLALLSLIYERIKFVEMQATKLKEESAQEPSQLN